jgi:hypothetical protein
MKRTALIVMMVILAAALVPAQSIPFADFQAQFQSFATAVAGTLASTASGTGLAWAPAYIGQLPHFGLGVSVGASLIPFTAVAPIFTLLNVQLPSSLSMLQTYGIPLPAAAIDARIGGLILPFDIGLKFGYLPPAAKDLLGNVQVDYLLAGGDVRIALLKDEGLLPSLSVGVGYTFFQGRIGLPNVIPGSSVIDISQAMDSPLGGYSGTHTLTMSSPDLAFNWQSSVIEAKVQVSKQLLIFVPTVGLSAAYGMSTAGGGLSSTVTYQGSAPNGMTDVQTVFGKLGYTVPSNAGLNVSAASTGWSLRAFGGLGISLLILDLDVSASYNLLTGSLGGGVNVRIQI